MDNKNNPRYSPLVYCFVNSKKNIITLPNLPVNRPDKMRVTVLQECQNLLSEGSFLSWRGLRNSLLYLFGDVITLEGNMIKANRKV